MIVVFLNNKLISCDTVVPLVKELSEAGNRTNFEFLCFDAPTYKGIRDNIVLSDAIDSMGTLRMLGRKRKSFIGGILHRFTVFPEIFRYLLLGLTSKATFIHFKALDEWPLKILSVFCPGRTILVQGSAIGYAPLEKKVSEMILPRTYSTREPMGDTILAFNKDWMVLDDPRIKSKDLFFLSPPFSRRSWMNYLEKKQGQYFETAFRESNVEPRNEIVPFMLCWMGPNNQTRRPDMYPELFDETLGMLEKHCSSLPIFVKPHPADAANEDSRKQLQNIIEKHPGLDVVITHLHPLVLSYRARFFIANTYTTTFSFARFSNIPTIEYTDYRDEILKETNFNSMRPDMVTNFINHDQEKLSATLDELMRIPKAQRPVGVQEPLPEKLSWLAGISQSNPKQ